MGVQELLLFVLLPNNNKSADDSSWRKKGTRCRSLSGSSGTPLNRSCRGYLSVGLEIGFCGEPLRWNEGWRAGSVSGTEGAAAAWGTFGIFWGLSFPAEAVSRLTGVARECSDGILRDDLAKLTSRLSKKCQVNL